MRAAPRHPTLGVRVMSRALQGPLEPSDSVTTVLVAGAIAATLGWRLSVNALSQSPQRSASQNEPLEWTAVAMSGPADKCCVSGERLREMPGSSGRVGYAGHFRCGSWDAGGGLWDSCTSSSARFVTYEARAWAWVTDPSTFSTTGACWRHQRASSSDRLRMCNETTWVRARAWAFVGPGLLTLANYRETMPARTERLTTMVEAVAGVSGEAF